MSQRVLSRLEENANNFSIIFRILSALKKTILRNFEKYFKQTIIQYDNVLNEMTTFETDIILVVKVPVLSLQITVVQPNVSTEGKDRTMAFNRAIRFVPRAKHLH